MSKLLQGRVKAMSPKKDWEPLKYSSGKQNIGRIKEWSLTVFIQNFHCYTITLTEEYIYQQ